TTPAPSKAGEGANVSTKASAPTAARSCSISESQKYWASCSARLTETQAARSLRAASSSQERRTTVLPLPAGAETSVTPPLCSAAESRSKSACRGIGRGANMISCPPSREVVPVATNPPPSSDRLRRSLEQRLRSHESADASSSEERGRSSSMTKPANSRKYEDRKSTRLNSSHQIISYAVFCFKKKKQ